jgi:hypothetical protein
MKKTGEEGLIASEHPERRKTYAASGIEKDGKQSN